MDIRRLEDIKDEIHETHSRTQSVTPEKIWKYFRRTLREANRK